MIRFWNTEFSELEAVAAANAIRNRNISHGIRNEPPPFAPTILGNLQMFPVPIAAPMVAKMSPSLPLNWSLVFSVSAPMVRPHFPFSSIVMGWGSISSGIPRILSSSENISLRVNPSPPQTIVAITRNIRMLSTASPKAALYGMDNS